MAPQINFPDASLSRTRWNHALGVFLCVLAFGLCGVCSSAAAAMASFYVDPVSGNDAYDGKSIGAPFRTVDRSRQAVAAIAPTMSGDITVYLRGGIHRLASTLTFGPTDSGTNGFNVVYCNYANEAPTISGGVDLSGGWTVYDPGKNIYKKTGVASAFRQLYVNGTPGIRARLPNRTDDNTFGPYYTMVGISSASKQAIINTSDIANWSGLTNVEMVMNPHWYHYRGRISSFTAGSSQALVTFQTPESNSIFGKGDSFWTKTPYYFENSLDFLDAEGEWFLDAAAAVLYYKPVAGENMASASIEAPSLDKLLQMSGSSATNKVHNIRFQGLNFELSGWNGPSANGSAMTQGSRELVTSVKMGAVTAQYADSLEFASCSFQLMGLNAISYVKGVTGGSIHDCDFRWISGNGIVIHDDGSSNPSTGDVCDNIKIVNNTISRIGQQYSNGIGIVAYFVKRLLVADNEICFCPYMGTQTGGQSGANINVGMVDNILRNNYVHHVLQFHDDGGAFYTLSRQPGTHVVDNCADSLQRSNLTGTYAVAGLYADNYSEYITFEHNATVNSTAATYEQTATGAQNNQWLTNVTTADQSIVPYTGRKTNYSWPVKIEAESMLVSGGAIESGSAYSNNSGVVFPSGTGTISTTFNGVAGVYNINAAYVTESTGAAGFRLLVNGTQVDAWTATLFTPGSTSPSQQIRHHITRAAALASGDLITLEATPASGSSARVDYVEIYARQLMAPLGAPTGLMAGVVSEKRMNLSWDPGTSCATYNVFRGDSTGGPFTAVATGVTGNAWTDSGLVQGHPYFYYVSANNVLGATASVASETIRATPHPFINRTSIKTTADAYVDRGSPNTNKGTAQEIVVKNAASTTIQRKGYMRFGLSGQTISSTPNAVLQLTASTWNEASTWRVYGLNDGDAGESWDENLITWYNAPANYTTTGDTLDGSRVTYLGSLTPAGIPAAGTLLEFRSPALDAFLLADTNHAATFILVRSTAFDSANTAIASREYTRYEPPTLFFDRAVADTDGDGFEDSFELAHGSNPLDKSSVPLKVTSHGFYGTQYQVTGSGFSPYIPYVLKRSTNLLDGFPVTIGTSFYSTDVPVTIYDPSPPNGPSFFYRFEPAP